MKEKNRRVYTARIIAFLAALNLIAGYGIFLLFDFFSLSHYSVSRILVCILFCVLFIQLSYGTTVAIFGFLQELSGGNSYRITELSKNFSSVSLVNARIAIVMPIYEENAAEVFSRIEVMCESITKYSEFSSFDFFILSDTQNLNVWLEEEKLFLELTDRLKISGKIYYRKRKVNLNKKSGNLADFCRRWGKLYKYMIVLDADSLMTGDCMIRLAKLMEANPDAGIIQTYPVIINTGSFFQKIMKFTSLVHGRIFSSGAAYWQWNSSSFWGHNAIIRLKPFMEYCGLPSLPRLGAVGGKILSHDTVEAALIRRSGYSVWSAYDLAGSFEEFPPNMIDSLKRDQRWNQGNLQHFWFLPAKGLRLSSRIHILLGIFSYLSSLLWLLYLIGMFFIYKEDLQFFRLSLGPEKWQEFWNKIYWQKGLSLQIYTITVLFFPRFLALGYNIFSKNYRLISGSFFLFIRDCFLEFLFSVIQAPILMYMHSKFVCATIFGIKIEWISQNRSQENTVSLKECFQVFKIQSLQGILLAVYLYLLFPGLFYWFLPIWISWIFSPLISYFIGFSCSKRLFGADNSEPEIKILYEKIRIQKEKLKENLHIHCDAYFLITVDPYYNTLHSYFQKSHNSTNLKKKEYGERIMDKLFREGPSSLTKAEFKTLYYDKELTQKSYKYFWKMKKEDMHEYWKENMKIYKSSIL